MTSPADILHRVLERYSNAKKWDNAVFGKIKLLSNTNIGDVGQDFVDALCDELNVEHAFPLAPDGHRLKQHPWDVEILGVTFEVKTATEDVNGAFQFNHVRYHREYQALLCVGIAPNEIVFDAWSKADVATGVAGHLVTMDKGSSATHKLTKRKNELRPIAEFERHVRHVTDSLR